MTNAALHRSWLGAEVYSKAMGRYVITKIPPKVMYCEYLLTMGPSGISRVFLRSEWDSYYIPFNHRREAHEEIFSQYDVLAHDPKIDAELVRKSKYIWEFDRFIPSRISKCAWLSY